MNKNIVIIFMCCGLLLLSCKSKDIFIAPKDEERDRLLVDAIISQEDYSIKTRDEAISFYKAKGVSLYFEGNDRLRSFDSSRPCGLIDGDLKFLRFFPEVSGVHLSDREITDSVFYFLKDLKNISAISLYNTKVTGEGFRFLLDKNKLIIFDFNGSPIDDNGLKYLSLINYSDKVLILNLSGSKITDNGMEYISRINFGKGRINLSKTSVSDRGIRFLEKFKELTEINLLYTNVSQQGAMWLKSKFPDADVQWGKPR
ncbi:MAG TPA: hypothetical protein PK104_05260 [Spirochaetota bacterium]|nr:hypothetical protein [Spirochaetota bacterium]HOQ11753.1 hypothetical protein [Spirochaetota bacterium]